MELSPELIQLVKEYNLQQYYKKYNNSHYIGEYDQSLKNLIDFYNVDVSEVTKLINNNCARFYRLRQRIELLFDIAKRHNLKVYFCTWTISDKNMSFDHRRKLKALYKGKDFVINVDYAPKTNRKHYHGIIVCLNCPTSWDYGFCKFIEVNTNSDFISHYIYKFTRHAMKEGTKVEKIIYSRGANVGIINKLHKLVYTKDKKKS